MSIIRVGLAETKKFAEGYEAIFGKVKKDAPMEATLKPAKKSVARTAKKKTKNSKS